jgi:2-polyprenyl-3-methyl-5-hydroxy-6-metoxy-1,4-benzoquinol methylase
MTQMLKENMWSRRVVEAENRFEFGRNWQRFLRDLDEKRIHAAEVSLREMLGFDTLAGRSFLDVGSGSGLFSLAARRLGAKVLSFDYDPESVACTRGLKTSFLPADEDWRVERGSALDREYLRGLGSSDIVYSWGVLHHTGAMWDALENMVPLVKHGGKLFIAIYNDQGKMSDAWRFIKKTYITTPRAFRFAILWPIALFFVAGMTMSDIYHLRRPRIVSGSSSPRGMSVWTDIVDWVGGYPFEVASPGQIADFYQRRGFRLDRQVSCGRKLGCNQFVFTKCEREQTANEQCAADSQRPPAIREP